MRSFVTKYVTPDSWFMSNYEKSGREEGGEREVMEVKIRLSHSILPLKASILPICSSICRRSLRIM